MFVQPDQGRRHEQLCLEVQLRVDRGVQVLYFQLTSNKDTGFICALELNEAQYQKIQQKQQLNCDFFRLPQFFVEMLVKCKETQLDKVHGYCIVVTMTKENDCFFVIKQNDPYKDNVRLELILSRPSEQKVIEFLVSRVDSANDQKRKFYELSKQRLKAIEELRAFGKDLRRENKELQAELKTKETEYKNALQQTAEKK